MSSSVYVYIGSPSPAVAVIGDDDSRCMADCPPDRFDAPALAGEEP
jgi:hypothetical protein